MKNGAGLVSAFLKRKAISLHEAMEQERKKKGGVSNDSAFEGIKSVMFAELSNGESILLS